MFEKAAELLERLPEDYIEDDYKAKLQKLGGLAVPLNIFLFQVMVCSCLLWLLVLIPVFVVLVPEDGSDDHPCPKLPTYALNRLVLENNSGDPASAESYREGPLHPHAAPAGHQGGGCHDGRAPGDSVRRVRC